MYHNLKKLEGKDKIRYNKKDFRNEDCMIKLVNTLKEANAVTHSGSFHADDIFSTIFLAQLKPIYLYRMKEFLSAEDYQNKIVFDIGRGEFDHHGIDAKKRENGLKYSAFGLLFEKFGRNYIAKKGIEDIELAYQMFLNELVYQIDAIDNGIFPLNSSNHKITTLSETIELFNCTWKEEQDSDLAFSSCLSVAEKIFNRVETRIKDKIAARNIVEKSILASQNGILILEQYVPFMDYLLASSDKKAQEIVFAIFPSNRGGYNIRAIPKESNSLENRFNFPIDWGGKTKEELVKLTAISSFRFCHINLFLCACDTLEDAIKIAQLAIKKE